MAEDLPPDDSKLTRSKRAWAEQRKFLTGRIARSDTERLPPGQHLVRDWPVLDLGRQPDIATARWQLRIDGLVERPVTLDWAAFQALDQSERLSDIHCVTTWSRYDNRWQGVSTRDLLDLVHPKDEAAAVMLHSYDGYTTNLPLADFAAEDALLAHTWEGKPLAREHGGPVRLVVAPRDVWERAQWISRIELLGRDRPGFWEINGYHMRGDPWAEERYSRD